MSVVGDLFGITQTAMSAVDKKRIADACQEIMDLQRQVADLRDEKRALLRRIEGLEADLAKRDALVRRGELYFVAEEDGAETGPVCPVCYRSEDLVSVLCDDQCGGRFCAHCEARFN